MTKRAIKHKKNLSVLKYNEKNIFASLWTDYVCGTCVYKRAMFHICTHKRVKIAAIDKNLHEKTVFRMFQYLSIPFKITFRFFHKSSTYQYDMPYKTRYYSCSSFCRFKIGCNLLFSLLSGAITLNYRIIFIYS